MVVLADKTDYGSFTEPLDPVGHEGAEILSTSSNTLCGAGGVSSSTTSSAPSLPSGPPSYSKVQKEGPSPRASLSSLQETGGSRNGRNAAVLQNNNNNISSSYTSLASNLSHRSVGSGNSTSDTTRPRNLSHRGSSPPVSLPVRGLISTVETQNGKSQSPVSSLVEPDPSLAPGQKVTSTSGGESIDPSRIYSNASSPMSSSSSGDFHQRQPLLQGESKGGGGWDEESPPQLNHPKESLRNGSVIRISIPGRTESDDALQKRFPEERVKTVTAFAWLCLNFMLATVSLALTHERLPDPHSATPLPDFVLDNIQAQDWALTVSEVLLSASTFFTFFLILFHKHRWIVFRRVFFILGVLYLMRSVTMFVTVLPVASRSYALHVCAPKANTTSLLLIAKRALQLMSGFGLSMNGQHVYCGDYMYSGHTVVLVSAYLIIKEYSSKRYSILHWTSFIVSLVGVIMILISRGHYTIDVLVAYYVTTRLFWMYHTIANNLVLKNYSNTNYLSRVWWFPVFRYLEGNVGGSVPRQYSCPSQCLTKLWRRFHLRRPGRPEYP